MGSHSALYTAVAQILSRIRWQVRLADEAFLKTLHRLPRCRNVTKLSILYFWFCFWTAVTWSDSSPDGAAGTAVCSSLCAGVTNKPFLLMRLCFSPAVSVHGNEFDHQPYEQAQAADS